MAPFAVPPVGIANCDDPVVGVENCVGPLYAGSVLLHPGFVGFVLQLVPVCGCVIVKGGHCTRNDWALAVTAAKKTITARQQKLLAFVLAIRPTSAARSAAA
jgi:hypothetical protein